MSPAVVGPLAVILGYLLGSLPWSWIIVRLHAGIDVRTVGSKSAGATNVLRVSGRWAALLALALDAVKGSAAVLLAREMEVGAWWLAAAAAAAVGGHVFPVFLAFRGGKGVATAAGSLALLTPWAGLGALLVFVVLVAWKRYVSLGSIAAAGVLPILVAVRWLGGLYRQPDGIDSGAALVLGTAVIAALVVFKHRANMARLRAGTESRLGSSGPAAGGKA